MIRLVLALYPRAWRRGYRAEVLAHVACGRLQPRDAADLISGALDAHLHPQWTTRGRRRWWRWPAAFGVLLAARRLVDAGLIPALLGAGLVGVPDGYPWPLVIGLAPAGRCWWRSSRAGSLLRAVRLHLLLRDLGGPKTQQAGVHRVVLALSPACERPQRLEETLNRVRRQLRIESSSKSSSAET